MIENRRQELQASQQPKPLIALVTSPKPFTDPLIRTIQTNALRSWRALGDEVAIVVVGDSAGAEQAAAEVGARYIPDVPTNEEGLPLVSAVFEAARGAGAPFVAYANADIILLPDFVSGVRAVAGHFRRFLAVARRWDLDVTDLLDFAPGWDERLRAEVARRGSPHGFAGIDLFVFPREEYRDAPPLVIGRAGWDNWMIYHARSLGLPVVEMSPSVMVIHQNHHYNHLPNGEKPHRMLGSRRNVELAGGLGRMFTLWEATHTLSDGQVKRLPPRWGAFLHRAELSLKVAPIHGRARQILLRPLRLWREALERRQH